MASWVCFSCSSNHCSYLQNTKETILPEGKNQEDRILWKKHKITLFSFSFLFLFFLPSRFFCFSLSSSVLFFLLPFSFSFSFTFSFCLTTPWRVFLKLLSLPFKANHCQWFTNSGQFFFSSFRFLLLLLSFFLSFVPFSCFPPNSYSFHWFPFKVNHSVSGLWIQTK